jgi:hypothetical protein
VDFSLSHGRVGWLLGLRIIHTICIVGQKSNSTKCMIGNWNLIFSRCLEIQLLFAIG